MAIQQFCLRWNNHQPNFVAVFTNLLSSESLVDVTLAAEGKHLQAHRVVLSACSSYFQNLFAVNPCQHPIVILKDVKYSDLKVIVDFMYYGEVNVSQEQLPAILKTAEMLKIKGLADVPEQSIPTGKSQSSFSSDKTPSIERLPTGESWGSDSIRRSPSPAPLSPSMRRKRMRKSSTGSGSGSTERTSEELTSEVTLIPSPSAVKVEPSSYHPEHGESLRSNGSLRNSTQEPSTDSEPREGSQDSMDEDPLALHISQDSSTGGGDTPLEDTGPGPSTSQSSGTQGFQWMMDLPVTGASHALTSPASFTPNLMYNKTSFPAKKDGMNSMMYPTYPTLVKRKRTNTQTDENFLQALEAVRTGGIGFCKAARMYGVNNRTLWLEYKKRGYPITRTSIRSRKPECSVMQSEQIENIFGDTRQDKSPLTTESTAANHSTEGSSAICSTDTSQFLQAVTSNTHQYADTTTSAAIGCEMPNFHGGGNVDPIFLE